MNRNIKLVYTILMLWRTAFLDLLVIAEGKEKRQLLFEDLQRINGLPFSNHNFLNFNYALLTQKMFRSLFYYRYKKSIFTVICSLFIRDNDDIEIKCVSGQIGGGILLYHNSGRVIDLYSCGKNLTVSQGVTIGLGKPDETGRKSPIIGNNCLIATNAVVFGPITIGDNVKIGAGSIVYKNVPSNCTVVGNPARIVSLDSKKVNIPL